MRRARTSRVLRGRLCCRFRSLPKCDVAKSYLMEPVDAFLSAACVPIDRAHVSGSIEAAHAILTEHPEIGADPNNGEVVYHTPETWDNGALHAVVETGKVRQENLNAMLLRKTDWHDEDGVRYLLNHGASPNAVTGWGKTALHNAVLRDNAIEIFEALLEYGGDPTIVGEHPEACRSAAGCSAVVLAARRGRGDVLDLFERRGVSLDLEGVDGLIAACARADVPTIRSLVQQHPDWVKQLLAQGGRRLVEFAGNGNARGVEQLLELGIQVDAVHPEGDPYFGTAPRSTALHAAAWRARHSTLRLLIERGAEVNLRDGHGQTALILAIKACVDSYWAHRRSPESVRALLQAGASVVGVPYPCGYADVDELLRQKI